MLCFHPSCLQSIYVWSLEFHCRRNAEYRRNTKGDAIASPFGVALFLCLLLLCSFLCCLLRWLLCCFLGCHLSILPIRVLQHQNAAVNECIEFLKKSVKKKMTNFAILWFIRDRHHDESDRKKLKTRARD